MNILITGAAGFLGKILTNSIAKTGSIFHKGTENKVETLYLLDIVDMPLPQKRASLSFKKLRGSLEDSTIQEAITVLKPDGIFHLASIVSSQAEQDFSLGMEVNLQGTIKLLESLRMAGNCPRLVMTSSLAVFGGELPHSVPDNWQVTPQSSYGTQKALCELLLNDYSRKGFVDAYVLRLPTVIVRPGKPNAASSSFISGIIREPLNGVPAKYHVPKDLKLWVISPQKAVQSIIHAFSLKGELLSKTRTLTLPGLSVSVEEMLTSLQRVVKKPGIRDLVTYEENKAVHDIVTTWPSRFEAKESKSLGFEANGSMDEIVEEYIRTANA